MFENTNGNEEAIETSSTVNSLSSSSNRERYVTQFNILRKKTAASIVEMSRIVWEASKQLTTDEYHLFCNDIQVKKGSSTLRKYECIGNSAELFLRYIDCLPSAWTSLYQLTSIPTQPLESAFAAGKIWPHMTGEDVQDLRNSTNCSNLNKKPSSPVPTTSQVGAINDQSYTLRVQFEMTPTPEVVAELQTLINNFMLAKDVLCNLSLSDILRDIVNAGETEVAECA